MPFTRQARRSAQREDLDALQFATDSMDRLLAGERLIASITADRNRALVAACAEYGRAAVADALGITRQAVYKRLQGTAVGKLVRTPRGAETRSRIRSLIPEGLPPEDVPADPSMLDTDDAALEPQLVGEAAGGGHGA